MKLNNRQVKECAFSDVRRFSSLAKKERSIVSETSNTQWFQIIEDGEVVGCCGCYITKKKIRLKGDYVLPQWRGRGLYTFVNNFRENYAKSLSIRNVEVLTLHPEHFKKRGYAIIKETRSGIWLAEIKL